MSRDKFLFAQSTRLYQQSENLANFLLATFLDDEAPFCETRDVLQEAGASWMSDPGSRKIAVELAWNRLIEISRVLDPRHTIPALLETVEQYYYGSDKVKCGVPWLGTATKTAVALVWGNTDGPVACIKAKAQVRRLVAAAGAWEQLNQYCDQAGALEFGTAEFMSNGVRLDCAEDESMRQAWNATNSKRGLSNRTLQNCMHVIWNNGNSFIKAVSSVLAGEMPSDITLFRGTVFEEIQPQSEFWLGLSVRTQLLAHASQFRGRGRNNITGISIFEKFAVKTRFLGSDTVKANLACQAMFWQRDWYRERLARRDFLSNMLIERPAVRIDDRSFVVALTSVGDSINCYVEHSVFRCLGFGGVPVSEEAFRRHVSQPFEDRVLACFTALGWKADHVSESGVWSGTVIRHPSDDRIPGEIDVLAIQPGGRTAILVECKVLASPFTASKLLNVAQKLGAIDSESFHSKLRAKAKWLRESLSIKDAELLPLLVVDEGGFIGKGAPNLVVDIEDLPRLIAEWERHVAEELVLSATASAEQQRPTLFSKLNSQL